MGSSIFSGGVNITAFAAVLFVSSPAGTGTAHPADLLRQLRSR